MQVGRRVFADRGPANTTVEEIASEAGVTKPLIYEHFGGKEGLYQEIVTREVDDLANRLIAALGREVSDRRLLEGAALAALSYAEESPDGFRVLAYDAPRWHTGGGPGKSILTRMASQATTILQSRFVDAGFDPAAAQYYAQMLVGVIAYSGLWWLEDRSGTTKEELVAHIVNMLWNGFKGLRPDWEVRP